MALLSLHNVSLGFGAGLLLDGVSLNIEPGDRACLVGRNGCGKSSLLKVIHGDVLPDKGELRHNRELRTAYLPQDVPMDMTGSVLDIVSSWLPKGKGGAVTDHVHHSVGKVLSHLSLDEYDDFAKMSGGQKRRVLLARALACEPDLLLLDEPTNHLDIDSICWMEEFLLRHCRTFLFVTHDRAFLRRISNRIIDLDRGQLVHWPCDYDTFLQRKAEFLHDEEVRQAAFDKKLAKEEIWVRQGVKARTTRNEGRVSALLKMREERSLRRDREGNARLQVQNSERSGNKVLETKNLSFSYVEGEPVIKGLDFTIMRGDKIGIIGSNGSGKSTFLKLITGRLQPNGGTLEQGTKLDVAYFDQHRAVLDDNATVAQNAGKGKDFVEIGGRPRHVIGYLQDFLFAPQRANTPVKALSGGERNRLLLAMLFATPSNLLIMDEPTNDLDAETLELLEDQLMAYQGTVLIVSHDRAFLDNVVTSLLVFEGDGVLNEYIGSYSDWLKLKQQRDAEAKARQKAETAKGPERKSKKKALGYKENRELSALPGKIEKNEAEHQALHARMAAPDYFKCSPAQIAADKHRIGELVNELKLLYDRWEELTQADGQMMT